jgi:hypothetical protein
MSTPIDPSQQPWGQEYPIEVIARLTVENATLKARVAELEAENAKSADIEEGLINSMEREADRIVELEAENATLKAELAMALDAANKGDKARCLAGAMEDRIRELEAKLTVAELAFRSIDAATFLLQARNRALKALAQLSQEGDK